ncbi:MAG: hypothetical protein ACREXX_02150 [Gammaproteobacteria bacterium]
MKLTDYHAKYFAHELTRQQDVEPTRIGKENRLKPEPHIAVAVSEGSHHVKHAVTDSEICDNRPNIGTAILAI